MFVIHTLCTNLTPKYDTPVSHLLKGLFKYGRFPIKVDRGRGGSRIFSLGGSGGTQTHCHRDAAGVSGEGTEGGLGLPQENFEYEVLQERF